MKLIRSTVRADVPECTPEEQAMVLDMASGFINKTKEGSVDEVFQAVCGSLIMCIGVALTRRYAPLGACIDPLRFKVARWRKGRPK